MSNRPYQTECLDAIRLNAIQGCNRQLVVLPTASGKTVVFSQLPTALRMRRPDKMLVLVQADELAHQALSKLQQANPTLKVGMEKAQYKASWSDDIIVGSVQTLGGTKAIEGQPGQWDWSKRLRNLNPDEITKVVIDECFPAGTDVGGISIDNVSLGDMIASFDHETGRTETRPVTRTFKRKPSSLIRVTFSDGSSQCCTPEHPWFTQSGYHPAAVGDYMMRSTMLHLNHDVPMHGMHCSDTEANQKSDVNLSPSQTDVLLENMQRSLHVEDGIGDDGQDQSEVCLRAHDEPKSNALGSNQGQSEDLSTGDGMEATGSGRERETSYRRSTPACLHAWVGYGISGTDAPVTGFRLPVMLQAGHRESSAEDRNRSGWNVAQLPEHQGQGSKEDSLFEFVRMDSVEVLEPTSDGTFGGVCPDGFVYNIEVEGNHNYFVNGILVHNCHHLTAKNYHGIMRYFGVMKSDPAYNNPDKFLLGVTATPNRSDNKGLEGFFEKIVYSRDIRTMIREGWLAEPIGHRVDTMVSLDGVRVTTGMNGKDYAEGELSKTVNTPERNSLIVDKYLELGEGAPFIGLTVDIQHTIDLTEMFRSRGVTCYGIASKSERQCEWLITDTSERRDVIQRYNNGEFKGLISCQALLEGFDAPRATVCLWARPTKSGLLYTQGTGRVLRPFPAPEAAATWTGWRKQHAIVIDFVDNCSTVGAALMTIPTLFGLRPDFNMQGKSAMRVLDEVERIKASKPAVNAELYTNLDALRAVSERIDLFAVPTTPPEIQTASKFTWTTGLSDGTYQLQLPDKGLLSIKVNALGEFEVSKHVTGVKTPLGIGRTLAEALRMADATVPAEAMILLKNDASWRKTPPSDPQISALKRAYPELRRPFASDEEFVAMVRHSYNKGQVSQLLAARPNPYAARGR